ncbi:histidine kinase [Niallia circulans]|uniref:histidine kinase n=1 Tax=Niallia circulans TaxID=1397 RepID=A0AA91TMY0_NIACI|nr:histidine kinase [Niallia circulans]PAD80777.1 histidine kinase [Niallia circulans]
MIKIRTKLLIYFGVILLLLLLLFWIRETSNQQVKKLYDENMASFFLLNEMTKETNQAYQSLQIYVHEPLPENLALYKVEIEKISRVEQQFRAMEKEGIPKKNLLNMINNFRKQTDKTVQGIENEDIQQYSTSLKEVEKISAYIHEKALDLIDEKLTKYQAASYFLDEKITQTKNMGTAILLSIILLSILFALWFSNGITITIGRLTKEAEEISAGRYNREDIVVSQKDELWFLTKTFNEMKKNILESVKQIEEKAKLAQLLKEMELKSLQNQINPHFLFNTLNTISKTAYIEGADKTSDLISSVSALLRYNIGSLDRQTLLKDEVAIVKEYFFIQKTRFGGRVEFTEDIDPECLSTPIPCLTLQPIIENAFIHGIERMAKGAKITLSIYEKEEKVLIEVIDNGVGMDQDTIDRLLDVSEETDQEVANKGAGHSTGIGMRNVIKRLRLFDKDSQVKIHSIVGEGTTVLISLNKLGKEDTLC